jgi:hypothetical protein
MVGPYPPNLGTGTAAAAHTGPHPSPPAGLAALSAAYPGLLPSPVRYPQRSRRRLVVAVVVLVAVVATLAAVIGYAVRGEGSGAAGGAGAITAVPAKAAIQGYLNALADRDIDTITRNSLCGIYDRVTDRWPDEAVAKMSSDAFRRQFSRAAVTSIDKIVPLSNFQAQALFTMRATPAGGDQPRDDIQGVAQLLSVRGHLLVCSYVVRTAGSY